MTKHIRRAPHGGCDTGVAMVMTICLMIFSMALVASMIAYATTESRLTGQERQRGSAISAAEGQIDLMISSINSATGTALPCSASTTDAASPPDVITVATTVTYYDAAGAIVQCPVTSGANVATALVRAVATSQQLKDTLPARRVMEALVRLTAPVYGGSLSKAIYGSQNVSMSNNADLYGNGDLTNADIYTNGSFACSNSQRLRGSVYAQGSITMSGSCSIDGAAWARTGFTAGSPSNSVGSTVRVSAGNATLVNSASVGVNVQAGGLVLWSQCPSKCTSGASVAEPPSEPFPQLPWDASTQQAWATNGYSNVVTNNNCTVSGGANGPGQWIIDQGPNLAGPTILRTTCALILQPSGSTSVSLKNNLAVFADGGIALGKVDVQSTTTAGHDLYLVQPFNAAPAACAADGITMDNNVSIDSTVRTFLYTPCPITKSNQSALNGQLYSGTSVTINNQLSMNFVALPVYGVRNGQGGGQTWKPDLLSKRESS